MKIPPIDILKSRIKMQFFSHNENTKVWVKNLATNTFPNIISVVKFEKEILSSRLYGYIQSAKRT